MKDKTHQETQEPFVRATASERPQLSLQERVDLGTLGILDAQRSALGSLTVDQLRAIVDAPDIIDERMKFLYEKGFVARDIEGKNYAIVLKGREYLDLLRSKC